MRVAFVNDSGVMAPPIIKTTKWRTFHTLDLETSFAPVYQLMMASNQATSQALVPQQVAQAPSKPMEQRIFDLFLPFRDDWNVDGDSIGEPQLITEERKGLILCGAHVLPFKCIRLTLTPLQRISLSSSDTTSRAMARRSIPTRFRSHRGIGRA